MTKVDEIKRFWRIGATVIEDECSALPFEKAFEMLCKMNPMARHTQVFASDGVVQLDGSIHYTIPIIPAKTNG